MARVRRRRGSAVVIEPVEPRQFCSATVVKALPAAALSASAPQTVALSSYFADPAITGTVVQYNTVKGKIDVELDDGGAPKTVANFLSYMNGGAYTDSIFHRDVPGFVLQGGGFTTTAAAIPQKAPVPNEFSTTRSNVAGTIAMAKLSSGPNTATNQWFFNLGNNAANLDKQNGGFTVFGHVIENTMTVVNALAGLTVVNATGINPAFDSLPVANPDGTFTASNLATIYSIATVSPLSYAVSSSGPAVKATVNGSSLTLTPQTPGGTATITVTATDLAGGKATSSFKVTVAAAPTGSIAGTVFLDDNQNGKYDAGEVGQTGWTVYLDTNNDGKPSAGEPSYKTGSAGTYSFSNLAAGAYHVRVVANPVEGQSLGSGGYATTLASGQHMTADNFGITLGSIAGTVFNDKNGNGRQDAGEAGYAGWTVFVDANGNGKPDAGEARVVTAANGSYKFPYLAAGTYRVQEVTPTGYKRTTPAAAGIAVAVGKGQVVTGQNFGYGVVAVPTDEVAPAVETAWDREIDG